MPCILLLICHTCIRQVIDVFGNTEPDKFGNRKVLPMREGGREGGREGERERERETDTLGIHERERARERPISLVTARFLPTRERERERETDKLVTAG
jgi:hypothetical protein